MARSPKAAAASRPSAREQIAALIFAYAERIDLGDLEGVARLFARASYGSHGGPVRRGSEEVLDALQRAVILHLGVPRTKHVISNLVIDVDEAHDGARARSYFTVLQAAESLPLQPVVAGRYHDEFARAGGEWHFTERVIFMDLIGDLRQHVRP